MSTSDQESLHALAFLYLTFGHATDGALTGDEMRAVAKRLQPWAPEASLEDLGEVLKKTVADYKAQPDASAKLAHAKEMAKDLGKSASPETMSRILHDLHEIAAADGEVSAEEEAFIAEVKASLSA